MALNDVPLPGQNLLVTRNPINQNFSVLDTTFSIDHVAYNTSGQGKHNKVTLPVQSPAPAFTGGDLGLYSFLNTTTNKNELYVHKITGAATVDIPLTASTLSATAAPGSGTGGWTYLPSGMFMTFGSGNGNGLTTVTLSFPPPTQILNVQLTPQSAGTSYVNLQVRMIDILSRTQFRIFVSVNGAAAAGGFSFSVIGY